MNFLARVSESNLLSHLPPALLVKAKTGQTAFNLGVAGVEVLGATECSLR
jgi:hypothetical protein